ncbi:lysophospholipid acyltransferase family protein [Pontibacillus halophilus]|uniref:lysophospholipid acyltransferase family protein n=1 Tax=Pontibacillus halophilus TaxID=516704 RepID=UPI0018CFCE7C|nr:lysophospholipid acyltransferase family protein [Pontibacillus halophilus]
MFEWVFHKFNSFFLKRHFQHIYVTGEPPLSRARSLFLVNHSTWWDPLVIFLLNRTCIRSDAYAMMSEEGVQSFPFFRRLGAFSVNQASRRDILASLHYAEERLQHEQAVWMFPQGEEQALEIRPLRFQNGASYVMDKVSNGTVVPIALYYTFQGTRKPNVYISIGTGIPFSNFVHMSRRERTTKLEDIHTSVLDDLKQQVVNGDTQHFQQLL